MSILFLVFGLILLAIAGDALVRGAISAAQRMHIPTIIIGLTIVAFGTSAPELIVSIEAALNNAPGLAIGNVIGSNIANTLLVLGVPALLMPFALKAGGIRRSTVFLITVSLVFILFIIDGLVTRLEGMLLFTLLIIYLTYSGVMATRARKETLREISNGEQVIDDTDEPPLTLPWLLAFLAFGIVGLGIGGKLTISGALGVADMFGVADTAVGLTIVALGTSLPELAASVAAALRRQAGVMVGNVLGSSVFNILGILGITAMLIPLGVPESIIRLDIWVMLAVFLLLLPIVFFTRKLNRIEGWIMSIAYLSYMVLVFINNT